VVPEPRRDSGRTAASAVQPIDRLTAFGPLPRLSGSVSNLTLSVLETREAGSLHGGNMDEDILRPVIRRDEAESLGVVEELDSAGLRHGKLLYPIIGMPGRACARAVSTLHGRDGSA